MEVVHDLIFFFVDHLFSNKQLSRQISVFLITVKTNYNYRSNFLIKTESIILCSKKKTPVSLEFIYLFKF